MADECTADWVRRMIAEQEAALADAEAIGDALHVVLPAGNLACAALLRDLVQRELPVCALELVRASLLESYQNTLNIQRDKL